MANKRIFDLEERLITYAAWVMNVVEELTKHTRWQSSIGSVGAFRYGSGPNVRRSTERRVAEGLYAQDENRFK